MPLVLGDMRLGEGIQPRRNISHNAFGCWDAYIAMQMLRDEAIPLWERVEKLHDRIAENPDHPNNAVAHERIASLDQKIMDLQRQFLWHDEQADGYWREMTVKQRKEEAVDAMFLIEPEIPTILGSWHRRLGRSDGAPRAFRISPVVLQFAPPHVAAAYTRGVR